MPYDPHVKDNIPNGTKVVKKDGTVEYFDSLERGEVPAHVIISRWEPELNGWSNIVDTTKVWIEDDRIIQIGDVPIGQKIIRFVKDDIPYGTKVVKKDGTVEYFDRLERGEVPAYVIISLWGRELHGYSNIVDTTKVETQNGRLMKIGDIPIGRKITSFVPEESNKCCNKCIIC